MKAFADCLIVFGGESSVGSRNHSAWIKPSPASPVRVNYSEQSYGPRLLHEEKKGPRHYWLLGEIFGDSQDLSRPEALNGHFILFAHDEGSNEWHVWTDRMGTFHAYYAQNGSRAAIGTFFPAVVQAASGKKLDWEGLAGFFAFGFFPADRTYFEDVRIFRPASHYVFDGAGKLKTSGRYWKWNYVPQPKRSYEETVEEFGAVLNVILRDQSRGGRIAVPISSGLDSRTVAAAIDKPGSFWAYSYGYKKYSPEIAIGRKIAQAAGLPHEAFVIPEYLFEKMDLILNSVEGFQGVASTRQAAITDQISANADYLLAAHWGDVWMDDMGFGGPAGGDKILEHALHKIEKNGGAWLLANLCKEQGNRLAKQLRGIVRAELDSLKDIQDPDFRIKAFKTDQWSFRWTLASIRMFQPGAFPRLPFYDNRMVDFCLSVPTDFVRGRRLQIDYLKQFHPEIARIPWDVTGESLFAGREDTPLRLMKRALKKGWRMISGRKHVGRNWEVQFISKKGKAGLDHWLLRKGLKIHEFVSSEQLRALKEKTLLRPDGGNGYALSQALTFSTFLETLK